MNIFSIVIPLVVMIIINNIIVSAPHIPAGLRILGFFIPSFLARLFSSISYPELQGKAFEYVYESDLVVPWGHLPRHEGAWGVVCCC